MILYLETSTKNCSVSIGKENKMLCLCEEYSENFSHSEKLHEFILWAIEGAEIQIEDLQAICVSKGPGSFTGLRIGVAAAKGLCFALNLPLISLNSLDILANSVREQEFDFIIPMLDARRKEVYSKIVDFHFNEVQETEAKILDEDSYQNYSNQKLIFVGDGAEKAKEILKLSQAKYLHDSYPSAKFMIDLGYKKFENQEFEDIAYFNPFYLKEFIGTQNKKS